MTILDELRGCIDAITPLIRADAAEAERAAGLTPPVIAALREARLFRLWIPRAHGGLELSLPDALRVYEAVARADGSTGWAVMIGSGGGLFAPLLEAGVAEALFRRDDALVAGSGAPDGRAVRVEGGYRVTGRWRYASGAAWATTFTANCVIAGGDGADGMRAMAFEPSQVRIHETWNTSGMRATGSHDIEVIDAFVPEGRSFAVGAPPREGGPLYRVPFTVLTELPVTAVALGIAAHALEAFAAGPRMNASRDAHARVQATVQAHRATVLGLAQDAWREAEGVGEVCAPLQSRITAACVEAVAALRAGARELADLAGMAALRMTDPLGRAARDLAALSAHASVRPRQN